MVTSVPAIAGVCGAAGVKNEPKPKAGATFDVAAAAGALLPCSL